MRIKGIQSLTPEELARAEDAGGRYVFFEYCLSFVFFSVRRPSPVYFLKADESGLWLGFKYSLVSLLYGWWALPWGPVYTPLTVLTNLMGGEDVTEQIQQRHDEEDA